MKRSIITLLFVALVAFSGAGVAKAEVVTLTFEGVQNHEYLGDFYNGGAGGDYGITFSSTAWASIQRDAGGTGNFLGVPSAPTYMLFENTGTGSHLMPGIINVADGFIESLSFYYASWATSVIMSLYDGFDGTGNLIASETLRWFRPGAGESNFTPANFEFNGIAHSIVFLSTSEFNLSNTAFDNMTFNLNRQGPNNPQPAPTPEPATVLLMGAGLLGMLGMRRRFKK